MSLEIEGPLSQNWVYFLAIVCFCVLSLRFGFSEESLARLIWWNTSINKSMYQLGEIHVICIFCWELGKINPVTKESAQVNLMGVKPKADSLRTLNFRWRKNIWEVKYSYCFLWTEWFSVQCQSWHHLNHISSRCNASFSYRCTAFKKTNFRFSQL